MTEQKELDSLVSRFRAVGGIARTKHDASGLITAVSIGRIPGGEYRRLGDPGSGWMPPVAAAELMRAALVDTEGNAFEAAWEQTLNEEDDECMYCGIVGCECEWDDEESDAWGDDE